MEELLHEDEIPVGRAKDLRGQVFGRLTVLYRVASENNKAKWKCQCECGNIKIVRQDSLTGGKIKSCGCLHNEATAHRMSAKLLNCRFGMLTVIEKTNKRSINENIIWKCQCDCGTIIELPTNSLTSGNTKSCGCLQRVKAREIGMAKAIDLTGQVFGKLKVIRRIGSKKENALWECLCECGSKCEVTGYNLRSGKTKSCGCVSSYGEWLIANLLKDSNLLFSREQSFENCRFPQTNNLARFDFYVNKSYLIEFDGSQHFLCSGSGWDTEENFEKTIQRDQYKNQWCKENNIPLIRIPYTKLDTLCIEDLMLETTQFRVV